jgi:hypothetical protein
MQAEPEFRIDTEVAAQPERRVGIDQESALGRAGTPAATTGSMDLADAVLRHPELYLGALALLGEEPLIVRERAPLAEP